MNQQVAALTNRTTFRVRFSEIDSMQIVWHGEYVRYFEDGREAFGKQYGLDYMSIYREGYMVPIEYPIKVAKKIILTYISTP